MSDETTKHPPEPDDQPHGIVEEIEHAVEQAVEHVPQPVRWTVRKLVLVSGLALVGLLIIGVVSLVLFYANRTTLVAHEVTLFVNGLLSTRSDVILEMEDLKGNPFRGVRLVKPRVRFRDSGNREALLEAPSATLHYSAWGLATGKTRSIDLTLESPVIRLTRREDGSLRLPEWKASGRARPTGKDTRVRFLLRNGTVTGLLDGVEGLVLDGTVEVGKATHVDLRELSWKRGVYGSRHLRMAASVSAGDSVHVRIRRLTSDDLVLSGAIDWKKGTPQKVVHADIERIRWKWVAQATKNNSFDVTGTGAIVVDAAGTGTWDGRFRARFDWDGLLGQGTGGFNWDGTRLAIHSISATSAAGNLEGDAVWSKAGWNVGGRAQDGDPSQWGALGIRDWPAGRLNGTFRYAVDSKKNGDATLWADLEASEISGWRVDQARVDVDFPKFDADSFFVSMTRRGGRGRLIGRAAEGGWTGVYEIEGLPLEEWPDGRASGIRGTLVRAEGTVAGAGGLVNVTGVLSGKETDWLGVHTAGWRLEEVSGVLLPKPSLTANTRLSDFVFLGIHFDSLATASRLVDQTLVLDAAQAVAGDTVVTANVDAAWSPSGWRVSLDRAEAKSSTFHWTAEPPVRISGDAHGVVFDRLRARDGGASLAIAGRWGVPGGFYDWTLEAEDLELARVGWPAEWQAAGSADLRLAVDGAFESPRWTFDGQVSRPGWQGHAGDSLTLAVAGEYGMLDVRRLSFRLDGGTLEGRARFDRASTPNPDTLSAEGVRRWLASAARWEGQVSATRFPLDHLGRWSPSASDWAGRVTGRLNLSGSPSDPVLSTSLEAEPISWQEYLLERATLRASFRDRRLSVDELLLTRASLTSRIAGTMPLVLDLGREPEIPEAPMSFKLEVPNGDLSVLPLFVVQIGSATGRFVLDGHVGGTPRHPDLDGYLRMEEGSLRLAGREELLEHVNASFRLDESRISLDTLTARQGERGRVQAHGVVEVSGQGVKGYTFQLTMRDFTTVETGLYAAQFDGDFTVTQGPVIDGHRVPFVTGRAELKRAAILYDFANQSEDDLIAASTQPRFWVYRIQVNANSNLHWQPPDGDIEFSANLSLEQTPEELKIYGDMRSIRGYYYFLSNRFNVTRADLVFDDVGGVNPTLDAEAVTRIVPLRDPSEVSLQNTVSNDPHDVIVRITGRSQEPNITLTSSPADWDQATILREMTLGRFEDAGAMALGDPLDNYLTRAINRTLSEEMSRAFRGYVSEWQLERERGGLLGGTGDIIMRVRSQITPSLQVGYGQRVGSLGLATTSATAGAAELNPFERDVQAEYRINRFFFVTTELIQRRSLGGQSATTSGAEFNVNLKARWEY